MMSIPNTPILPPILRSSASFESFHSLSLEGSDISEDESPIKEEGLRHVDRTLVAKKYKQSSFANDLACVLTAIRIPSWHAVKQPIQPTNLAITKVSGSLTNAVFFVNYPNARTLLLRIYGPSSGRLISRPRELHILHVLSSRYQFGPKVFGTFANGRIEEYFDSKPLSLHEMREEKMSRCIAVRMAELHRVDIESIEQDPDWDLGVRKNIRCWISPARECLLLAPTKVRNMFDLDGFIRIWERYWNWLRNWEKEHGASPRVFAHNDTQYGNLLRLNFQTPSRPVHHQIMVVDFEYASPNPAAFDIANHFHEWTADYNSTIPWKLNSSAYPSHRQRRTFYETYLYGVSGVHPSDDQLRLLEFQVRAWSPASHAMWAIWGIVQAREVLETGEDPEFNYLGYAECRLKAFREGVVTLMNNVPH